MLKQAELNLLKYLGPANFQRRWNIQTFVVFLHLLISFSGLILFIYIEYFPYE